jgi:hypothetical protein
MHQGENSTDKGMSTLLCDWFNQVGKLQSWIKGVEKKEEPRRRVPAGSQDG